MTTTGLFSLRRVSMPERREFRYDHSRDRSQQPTARDIAPVATKADRIAEAMQRNPGAAHRTFNGG